MRRRTVLPFFPLVALTGALLSGCGQARQDANEHSADYTVDIVSASFPANQKIASTGRLVLVVRNTGRHDVPNLAVTINSFTAEDTQPGLASAQRPVWIVDVGPGQAPTRSVDNQGPDIQGGDTTAYTNTWASGPLVVGKTATLVWKVTPVRPGTYTIGYRVAAGLNGNARARTSNGAPPQGHFTVNISRTPAQSHVDPGTGRVVPGPPSLGSS